MGLVIEQKTEYDRTIHRLSKNGIVDVEVGADDYIEPRDGEKRLMVSGYSDAFEMTGQFGTQQKLRVEFRIEEGVEKGGRFASLFTLSVHPKSNLGKVLVAAGKAPIEGSVDIEDYLGKKFYGVTKAELSAASGNTYISIASARPDDGNEPAPAKSNGQAKPAASDDDWPTD